MGLQSRPAPATLGCRITLVLPMLSVANARQRRGQAVHSFEPRGGAIGFAVDQWGLLAARGDVSRFEGQISFEADDPQGTVLAFSLDPRSLRLTTQDELPGVDEIVAALPQPMRFHSTAVESAGPDAWSVRGLLQLGNVTRLVTLQARLVATQPDAITQTEVVEVLASGQVQLGAFGLPHSVWFGSALELQVHARLERATSSDE